MTGICQDRVVIVTGAGGGLGAAHARVLASEGACVIVNDINLEAAQRVVDEIEAEGQVLNKFNDLAEYVVKHFTEEEALMEANNYDRLDSHKLIHKNLLERMGGFKSQIEDGSLVKDDLVAFLRVWLTSHIKGIDARYGKAINGEPLEDAV